MSRTFRNSKKNKVLDSKAISYNFSWGTWGEEERRPNRIAGGAIVCCPEDEERFWNVISGKYQVGIPRFYRKTFNKKQKTKMNQKLFRDLKNENYEDIGGEKFVKNAGYYYY